MAGETDQGKLVRGVERTFEVRLGALGGFELRPTRCFVWAGAEREGRERVVSLGTPPRSLDVPRREHRLDAGAVHMRTLGNPVVTMALAGIHAARRVRTRHRPR
ncbi:MAG TPA: hypothetical protein VH306_00640 [Gaiellaceae bacterium]